MNVKIQGISRGKKFNKLWRKLYNQYQVKFKSQACLRKKKEYNTK